MALHELLTGTAEWQAVQARKDEHDTAKKKARAKWEAIQARHVAAVEAAIANADPVPPKPAVAPWAETDGYYLAKSHEFNGEFRTAAVNVAERVAEALAAREAELAGRARGLAAELLPQLVPLLEELESISETRGELTRSARLVAASTGKTVHLPEASAVPDGLFELGEAVKAVAGEVRVPAGRRSRA